MKYKNHILLLIIFLTWNIAQAQDKINSKFSLSALGGIGYAIIENDNEPNYNLNSNNGELLINYHVDEKLGFATGIGLNELSGNGFNSIGSFYHERTFLKIPLLVTFTNKLSDNFTLIATLGLYGQNIIKDEYRFLNNYRTNIYEGWNFGLQASAGLIFNVSNSLGLGFAFSGQSDFSKFESNNNAGINDEQKIKNLNSIGMILQLKI